MALNEIPQAGQTLNTTRPLILQNFTTFINDQFKVDHQEFNTGANSGKHKGIHIIDGSPAGGVGTDEIGFYNTVTGGTPALMIKAGASAAVDITTLTTSGNERTITLSQGLIVKFGFTTGAALAGNAWTTVNFGTAFPTACLYVYVASKVATAEPSTAQTTSLIIVNSSFAVGSFKVFNRRTDVGGAIPTDCYYLAVGN